jgi:hypothetical protein
VCWTFDFNWTPFLYSWPHAHSVPHCAESDSRRTLQNVSRGEGRGGVYVTTFRSIMQFPASGGEGWSRKVVQNVDTCLPYRTTPCHAPERYSINGRLFLLLHHLRYVEQARRTRVPQCYKMRPPNF